jgi:hypothetical protein
MPDIAAVIRPFPDQIESLRDRSDRERMVYINSVDPSYLDQACTDRANLIEEGSRKQSVNEGIKP